jgi:diguanylate cyclase (GGDEF)-like protein
MGRSLLADVFALAALVALITAVVAWRRRRGNPAALALAGVMVGIAVWSLADGVLVAAVPHDVRRAALPVVLVGVGVAVLGLAALPRALADPSWRPRRRTVFLLLIEPVAIVVATALPVTFPYVYGGTGLDAPAGQVRTVVGPLFQAHSAYSYLLIAGALVQLVRRWRGAAPVFRRQTAILLVSALPPVVGNVTLIVAMSGAGAVDVTPLFFLATGLISGFAVLRNDLLALVPVARSQVVETVSDAVFVVDPSSRLLDLNPAARALVKDWWPTFAGEPVGRTLQEIAGADDVQALRGAGPSPAAHTVEVRPGLHVDVRTTPVTDPRGRSLGWVSVVRDVTEARARQAAVERLNDRLGEQLQVIERLQAELAEEAVRDHLTGLYNRRHLDRALATSLLAGGEEPVALVVIDVDHFKRVNDRFGHAAGDQVLRGVADALRAETRPGDTVARLGGEEFVLVLPGATAGQAAARAESVRRSIASTTHRLEERSVRVTVSAGVAVWVGNGGPGDLLAAGDRALYAAKAEGRDRVVVAGTPDVGATGAPAVPTHA